MNIENNLDKEEISLKETDIGQKDLKTLENEVKEKGEELAKVVDTIKLTFRQKIDEVASHFRYGSDTLARHVKSIEYGNMNFSQVEHSSRISTPKNLGEFIPIVEDRLQEARKLDTELDEMVNKLSGLQSVYESRKRKAFGNGIDKNKFENTDFDLKYYDSVSLLDEIFKERDRCSLAAGLIKKSLIELKSLQIKNSIK